MLQKLELDTKLVRCDSDIGAVNLDDGGAPDVRTYHRFAACDRGSVHDVGHFRHIACYASPKQANDPGRTSMLFARMTAIALLWHMAGPHFAAAQAPASGGPVDAALIEDLVAANRILADQGVLDAYGHVSIRHPANPNRYLVSRAMSP